MDGMYFKVGLFVIIATVILVVGAGILGAGAMQENQYLIETYLNEAVSGLDVGAVVKYRGVPIGNLKEITFVSRHYQTTQPYIMLILALDAAKVDTDPGETAEDALADAVERGVRARLASGGLTGASYIEIDFKGNDQQDWDPPLAVDWKPEHLYLPSIPSTLKRLEQGAEKVFKEFADADIPGLIGDIRKVVQRVDGDLRKSLAPTLDNLEVASKDLVGTIEAARSYVNEDLRPETRKLTEALLNTVENDLSPAIRDLNAKIGAVAVDLDRLVVDLNGTLDKELTPALKNVRVASDGLPAAVETVNNTLRSIDIFAGSERGRIDEALENIRVVTADLRQLVEGLKRNPSRALFGNPPPPIQRGEKR